ncbi:MAG: type IX secretion system sortase PorU [Candidatus Glassbacteria bacterium]|nr:type IX secretion system sortase PorU [Candidatus Glassbacteria bacterium]
MAQLTRSRIVQAMPAAVLLMVLATAGESPCRTAAFDLVGGGGSRVVLSFRLPAWRLVPVETGAGEFYRIEAAGGEVTPRAGHPELPLFKATVAVPPGAVLNTNWNILSSRTVNCGNLLPAQPIVTGERNPVPATEYAAEIINAGGVNARAVEISGPARLRDFTVAEIIVRPFAWNMKNGTLRVTESLQVSLEFKVSAQFPGYSAGGRSEKLYETLYRNVILNYEDAVGWRGSGGNATALLAAGPFGNGANWVEIRIDSSGMYALSGSSLQSAGVDPGQVEIATMRLLTGGNRMLAESNIGRGPELEEVAISVLDGGDGRFDASDRIIFHGRGTDRFNVTFPAGAVSYERHRYENHAAYWLTWGGSPASVMRIATAAGNTSGGQPSTAAERWLHYEDNTQYLALEQLGGRSVNPAPDYWGWVLEPDRSGLISRTFALPAAPSAGTHSLRFELYGRGLQYPSNWTVSLNGGTVQSRTNREPVAITSEWFELAEGQLAETGNSFTLAARGHYLGWFELRAVLPLELVSGSQLAFHERRNFTALSYRFTAQGVTQLSLYEVTVSGQPAVIPGESPEAVYNAPPFTSNLTRSFIAVADDGYREPVDVRPYQPAALSSLSGAEYLVIAPRELAEQAGELARMRSQRFSTAVVAVEDIYAEYALGSADPVAIRNFLFDAYTNWPVRPQIVVFFGDGHVDYRGVTSLGRSRPNLVPPWVDTRDIAVEEWFVRFDSTGLPQIATGRIPVKTPAEAELVLDKIAAYEEGRDAGEWSRRIVLVADDGYVLGRSCDFVLNHVPGSEKLDSLIPVGIVRRKIYLDSYRFDPPEIGTRKPAANQDLINWWNRGALLVNYLGHGGNLHWAQERVFDGERDVALLNNGYRLPLVLNSSCSIGHFDDYREEAMAERILLKSGGGAVAVFAGTRVTYAFQNQVLNQKFVEYLFADEPLPLGMIHLQSRWDLAAGDRGNAERYSVFGDPALILHRPSRDISVSPEPGQQLAPGGKVEFSGTVGLPGGGVDGGFSGVAQVKFLLTGRPVDIAYQCLGSSGLTGRNVSFERTPSVLFDGPVTVAGGAFSGAFVLPLRLAGELPLDSLQGATGLFSVYATSETTDAAGASEQLALPLTGGASSDTSAPEIRLLSGGRELSDGDRVSRNETLLLALSDQSGINTTGRAGEQLTVEVDGGTTWSADLTGLFSYNRDSYQQGTAEVALSRVPEGLHSFLFRAVDNALNSSRLELMLNITDSAAGLALSNVVNYPNPFSEKTSICFELTQPAEVLIRIFTVAGRPVKQLRTFAPTAGFHMVDWYGTDEYQQKVANGVYLYKITCRSVTDISSSEEVEAVGKALLSR